MKSVAGWSVAAVAVLALVVWREWGSVMPAKTAGAPPAPVVVVAAERVQLADRLELIATAQARESVDITPTLTAAVTGIHFKEGQRVRRGDVLVSLNQAGEQALLSSARAALAEQERELARAEALARTRALSQTELDNRRTQVDTARHRVEEAEARVSDRTLLAPFDGVLGLRRVSLGALVSPGTLITTLDDISTIKLEFSVPEARLGLLQAGASVRVRGVALGGREFSGRVTQVDTRINPADRSLLARAELPNPEGALRPGMMLNVELSGPAREAVLVPEVALQSGAGGHFVWVMEGDKPQRRPVSPGARQGGRVELRDGLRAGERVVAEGAGTLRPGQPLLIKEAR